MGPSGPGGARHELCLPLAHDLQLKPRVVQLLLQRLTVLGHLLHRLLVRLVLRLDVRLELRLELRDVGMQPLRLRSNRSEQERA